jgi:hypothetical protein
MEPPAGSSDDDGVFWKEAGGFCAASGRKSLFPTGCKLRLAFRGCQEIFFWVAAGIFYPVPKRFGGLPKHFLAVAKRFREAAPGFMEGGKTFWNGAKRFSAMQKYLRSGQKLLGQSENIFGRL